MPAGRPKDHIVESQGMVYRIGRTNWKNWLNAKAKGDSPTIGEFGGRVILAIDRSVNDYTPEEAQSELNKQNMATPTEESVSDFDF